MANGAVAVGLLDFAELELKHDLSVSVGAGHLSSVDFSYLKLYLTRK